MQVSVCQNCKQISGFHKNKDGKYLCERCGEDLFHVFERDCCDKKDICEHFVDDNAFCKKYWVECPYYRGE